MTMRTAGDILISVGPPGGLSTASVPSKAARRRAMPRRPVPRVDAGAAAAVVGHPHRQQPGRVPSSTVIRMCRAPACLMAFDRASVTAK